MFNVTNISCDVCGKILNSFGCCVYGDEQYKYLENLCKECEKAVDDAKEQVIYLKKLK